jgi:hypothetical protein
MRRTREEARVGHLIDGAIVAFEAWELERQPQLL